MEKKKHYDVTSLGVTVCFYTKDKSVAFLTDDRLLYWINFEIDKRFVRMSFTEGQIVWLYVVVEKAHVVAVTPYGGEAIESILVIEAVEL